MEGMSKLEEAFEQAIRKSGATLEIPVSLTTQVRNGKYPDLNRKGACRVPLMMAFLAQLCPQQE